MMGVDGIFPISVSENGGLVVYDARLMGYLPMLEMVSVPFSRILGSNFPVRT
jgi:hypothetical protein